MPIVPTPSPALRTAFTVSVTKGFFTWVFFFKPDRDVSPEMNPQPERPGITFSVASLLRSVRHGWHKAPTSIALRLTEACEPPNHAKVVIY